MSEHTNEANPQSQEAGKLYDSGGQVIRNDHPRHLQQRTSGQVMDFIHQQPLAAVVIAFGLGYFVGKII